MFYTWEKATALCLCKGGQKALQEEMPLLSCGDNNFCPSSKLLCVYDLAKVWSALPD